MKYLIFNKERSGEIAYWWRPGKRGYTIRIEEAGRYDESEARKIVAESRGGDLMIPEAGVTDGPIVTSNIVNLDENNNLAEIEEMGLEAWNDTEPDQEEKEANVQDS